MQTYMANPDKIERKWYVVDADGCTLGRLASGVASVLQSGENTNPWYGRAELPVREAEEEWEPGE